MAALKPHVPGIYRFAATGLSASMWFFVSPPRSPIRGTFGD